jgi:hypothetical protein
MARKELKTATAYFDKVSTHAKFVEYAKQQEMTKSQVLVKAVEKLLSEKK